MPRAPRMKKFTLVSKRHIIAKCEQVVDGDTVWLKFKHPKIIGEYAHRCRLARINAPDSPSPYCNVASNYLKQLIDQKTVHIIITGEEKYGRPLVEIFVRCIDDTYVNINNIMLTQHYIRPYE